MGSAGEMRFVLIQRLGMNGPTKRRPQRGRRQKQKPSAAQAPVHDPQAVYAALQNEVRHLHGYWKLYGQLFTDQAHVSVLGDAAPSTFRLMQESLAQSLEIGIGRLLDTTGNHQQWNLTLRRIPDLLRARGHRQRADEAEVLVAALKRQAVAIITRRHKRTAHSDLDVALGKVEIDPVTWQLIDEAVALIRKLMVYVEVEMRGESIKTQYERMVLRGDGNRLVRLLKKARAHGDCERKALGRPLRNQPS